MKNILTILTLVCLIGSGCGWFEPEISDEKFAQELAWDGMDEYEAGNYKLAILNFERLKDWYPFSKFAMLAELKIGDCYYHMEEYDDAIAAYKEFVELHPQNDAVPYVIYQIGMCHYDRMDTVDRDQTVTREALLHFSIVRKEYPKSEYANKAEENISKCYKLLAGHELYVGRYYFRLERYEAALHRFKSILKKYHDVGVSHLAMEYIAECQERLSESRRQKTN
jgi:outer membrane protein assembly factor BamD